MKISQFNFKHLMSVEEPYKVATGFESLWLFLRGKSIILMSSAECIMDKTFQTLYFYDGGIKKLN